MMRQYAIQQPGKQTTYQGFDYRFKPTPSFIALVQTDDTVEPVALEANHTTGLDAYCEDNPHHKVIGVYKLHQ